MATIAIADYAIGRWDLSWLRTGVLDEPAHLATAILLTERPTPAYIAGALLPDLDHVPLAFAGPTPGDPRPRTHSIYVVLPALLLSRDLAAGVLAHFARDVALGPGIPLFGGRHVRVPYGAYAVLILASAYSRSRPL